MERLYSGSCVRHALEHDSQYWDIKRAVKDRILNLRDDPTDFRTTIVHAMEELQLTAAACNLVHDIARSKHDAHAFKVNPAQQTDSPRDWALDHVPGTNAKDNEVDSVRAARQRWDHRVAERINTAARNGVPWIRVRVHPESTPKTLPPCYEDNDLLDAVTSIRSANCKGTDERLLEWGRIHLRLRR